MKKTIEKLFSKDEARRLLNKDAIKARQIDSNSVRLDSDEELSEKEILLYRYGMGKNLDKETVSDKNFPKKKSIDDEFTSFAKESKEERIFFKEPESGYKTLKDDFERLSNYEELSKQYQLTPEQNEAVGNIYARLKQAEEEAANLGGQYKQMSEKVKEIANVSKRMMEEISGSYLKDVSEYRHTP